ncbi:alpha-1,2-fucosyltransferase [Patescibacteria group bacterium]
MKDKKKKVIILQHGGGELANQLWNFVSIYVYCLEKDFDCQNYSFFEHGRHFNIPTGNKLIDFIFFKKFKNHHARRNNIKNRFWRFAYKVYVKTISIFIKKRSVSSINQTNKKTYLPPTGENSNLDKLEKDSKPIYFLGWLFRNPKGLDKYREEIIDYFKPIQKYTKPADKKIEEFKSKYKNVIGVHIRQNDYKDFKGGVYFIKQQKVVGILEEYLLNFKKNRSETIFIIKTDGNIEKSLFENLNIDIYNSSPIEDLYTLSLCDVIIGSNSSFGNFASFYGNIPHLIFQNDGIDWIYYKNKDTYFENKYFTMT